MTEKSREGGNKFWEGASGSPSNVSSNAHCMLADTASGTSGASAATSGVGGVLVGVRGLVVEGAFVTTAVATGSLFSAVGVGVIDCEFLSDWVQADKIKDKNNIYENNRFIDHIMNHPDN